MIEVTILTKEEKLKKSVLFKLYKNLGMNYNLEGNILIINCNKMLLEVVNYFNLIVSALELNYSNLNLIIISEDKYDLKTASSIVYENYKKSIELIRLLKTAEHIDLQKEIHFREIRNRSYKKFKINNIALNRFVRSFANGANYSYYNGYYKYLPKHDTASFILKLMENSIKNNGNNRSKNMVY